MSFIQFKVKNYDSLCYIFGQNVTYVSLSCLLNFHDNGAGMLEVIRLCYSILICEFDMVHLSCGLEVDLRLRAKHEEICWLA